MSSLNSQANHSFLTHTHTRTRSIYPTIDPEPLYASQAYSGKVVRLARYWAGDLAAVRAGLEPARR